MKKIMMTIAAAFVATAMNAQGYIGGNVGFTSAKANVDGAKATTEFTIAPEVGYNLNDSWAIGAALGFTSVKAGDADAVTAFTVAPYARYTFAKLEKVNFFLDGQFAYSTLKDTYDQIGVHIIPGVAVNLNEKVSFVAKLGGEFGGLGWTQTKDKGTDIKVNEFGFDLQSLAGLTFGLYYNF